NIKPKAVIKAQNVWNKVLWALKKEKPNYFDGTIPTCVIERIFAWTDPSAIKQYRLICRRVNEAVTTIAFARLNLSAFLLNNYHPDKADIGYKLDKEWELWLESHRYVFTEVYSPSKASRARAIRGKWEWSQLRIKPNYFDGCATPIEVIKQFFKWSGPSVVKEYRHICQIINKAITDSDFARINLSTFVPRDYQLDIGHKLDKEWTTWLEPHRFVFTQQYLPSNSARCLVIRKKWELSQLVVKPNYFDGRIPPE
ncbi:UNVERIFIED_CONTAM: hypothetical protein HDU68_003823, partial [Siphonaria sp. JEL0065]